MKQKRRKILILVIAVILAIGFVTYNMLAWNKNIVVVTVAEGPQLNQKLKDALVGDGVIELTEAEVNSVVDAASGDKGMLGGRVKYGYIDFIDDKVEVNTLVRLLGHDFFVRSLVTPSMVKGSVNLIIDNVTVGKIRLPRFFTVYLIKKYLPQNYELLNDGSIDIGSRVFMFDIKGLSVKDDSIRITLNMEMPEIDDETGTGDEEVSPDDKADTENDEGPDSGNPEVTKKPTPAPVKADPRTAALKRTNKQLYGVIGDVKTQSAKDWVSMVIGVNSKMIENPDVDFSADINRAKAAYGNLPQDVRDDIKMAALNNLDMSSVRYLVNEYGL